jgi:hypothetical protein
MAYFDLLHFDTNDNNSLFTGNHCYDTTFTLSNAYKRIRKINLASLEMPIVFTNIRTENTSNIINIKVGELNTIVALESNDYTDISVLLNDINAKFNYLGAPVFSLVGNIVKITIPTANTIELFDSVLVNLVLGFPKKFKSNGATNSVSASFNYNLNYDNFISLYLNIPSTCTSSGNRLISYKIPLNALSGMVYYMGQNNSFEQSVVISDQNFVLSNFRIQVFDRFGYPITQSTDYTFTLAFFYYC